MCVCVSLGFFNAGIIVLISAGIIVLIRGIFVLHMLEAKPTLFVGFCPGLIAQGLQINCHILTYIGRP